MILSIFRWVPRTQLSKLALVCKKWRQVAYDDSLWSRLDLGGKTLHGRNLEHVLKRGVSILRLSACNVSILVLCFHNCEWHNFFQINDPVIKEKSSYLPSNFVSKLQYLDLTMVQISPEGKTRQSTKKNIILNWSFFRSSWIAANLSASPQAESGELPCEQNLLWEGRPKCRARSAQHD